MNLKKAIEVLELPENTTENEVLSEIRDILDIDKDSGINEILSAIEDDISYQENELERVSGEEKQTVKEGLEFYCKLKDAILNIVPSDPYEILENIIDAKDMNEAEKYFDELAKISSASDFVGFCETIGKKAKQDRIAKKKLALFITGEKYYKDEDFGSALRQYKEAKSLPGNKDSHVYYRIANIYFTRKIDNVPADASDADSIVSNYYKYAMNDRNTYFPEAWLDVARICLISGGNDFQEAIRNIETFVRKTSGMEDYADKRSLAEEMIRDLSILQKAASENALPKDIYSAAMTCAFLAEQSYDNSQKYLFAKPAQYFYEKTLSLMDNAIQKAQKNAELNEVLVNRRKLYEQAISILGRSNKDFDDECSLAKIYFSLQEPFTDKGTERFHHGIDETLSHIGKAVEMRPENEEALSDRRFYETYMKCQAENPAQEDLARLADEYVEQGRLNGSYEKALFCLNKIKNTRIGKEKLFSIYYDHVRNFSEAERIARELVKEEIENEKAGKGSSFYYREALLHIYCLNGKLKDAINICKGENGTGGLLDKDDRGKASFDYACICEKDGNMLEAKEYYKISADKEYPAALFRLFELGYTDLVSSNGEGDVDSVLNCLDMSAESGYPFALYQRGYFRLNDNMLGYTRDEQKGMDDLLVAAKKGHPDAAMYLIQLYLSDDKESNSDKTKKIIELVKLIRTSSISTEDQPLFPNERHSMLPGMPQNETDKVVYFAESMLTGNGQIRKNTDAGLELLRAYAEKGNARACSLLGEAYYLGIHGEKEEFDENALRYQRHNITTNGKTLDKDIAMAEKYLSQAAMKLDKWASYYYALLLIEKHNSAHQEISVEESGSGLIDIDGSLADFNAGEKVKKTIMRLLTEASGNIPQAKYWLGVMYESGKAVSQNEDQAKNCYSEAADAGFPPAMIWLARWYIAQKDNYYAMYWYAKACICGSDYAADQLASQLEREKDSRWPRIFTADGNEKSILPEFRTFVEKLATGDTENEENEEDDNEEDDSSYRDSFLFLMYLVSGGNELFKDNIADKDWRKKADKADKKSFAMYK